MTDSSNCLLHFFRVSKKAFGNVSQTRSKVKYSENLYSRLPEELCPRQFSLAEIKAATDNFDEGLIIGRSSFGSVYKGIIDDGTLAVAIRRLKLNHSDLFYSSQDKFQIEVLLLCQLHHLNIESLIGFCNEKKEMIVVYEYLSNGALFDCLHVNGTSSTTSPNPLPWEKRLEICIGVARGLHYLHTGAKYVVMHRNVNSRSILLDHELVPKLSAFFVSKLVPLSRSKALIKKESLVVGNFGYLDPEYSNTFYLSEKSDVYSFGVVLLEVLCGKKAVFQVNDQDERLSLANWASWCFRNGTIYHNIDPYLKGRIAPECFEKFVEIALVCISDRGKERPSMGEVEATLELALELQRKADSKMESINPHGGFMYEDVLFCAPDSFGGKAMESDRISDTDSTTIGDSLGIEE